MSRDRGEAGRARAGLLTLAGWTSRPIAEAFGGGEDTVRLWRRDVMTGGVEALKATVAPGRAPVTSAPALRVALPLLAEPVADRPNGTIPPRRSAIEACGPAHQPLAADQGVAQKTSAGGRATG